jgi:hypothetical protein
MSQRRTAGERGGSTLRDRFDRKDIQKAVMEAGKDPNFRNRPEIVGMRNRAARAKEKMAREAGTLEGKARSLRQRR